MMVFWAQAVIDFVTLQGDKIESILTIAEHGYYYLFLNVVTLIRRVSLVHIASLAFPIQILRMDTEISTIANVRRDTRKF